MTALYVFTAFVWWVGLLVVLASWSENRRERDIRACCSKCTPSRATSSFLASEGRPAEASSYSAAKVDRPNPAAFALPVEAAGPS